MDAGTILRDRAGIDPDEYADTLTDLASGAVMWVVVSGKMCAGKDTIAPALVDLMPTRTTMLRYGNLMRAELDPALDVIRAHYPDGSLFEDDVVEKVAETLTLPLEHARTLVDRLAPEMVASDGTLTASSRTEGIRSVLQDLGDDWRCIEDPDYWARKAAQESMAELASGRSVILTGGRFLPDVDMPRAAGAFLLRLSVTRQTQIERLSARDGIAPSAETLRALDHKGETALDGYAHFDTVVDNNGHIDKALHASRTALATRLEAAA